MLNVKLSNIDCSVAGIPEEFIEKARSATVVTEIKNEGGLITVTRIRPSKTTTNSFRLGEETELDTIKGDKIKVSFLYQLVSKG